MMSGGTLTKTFTHLKANLTNCEAPVAEDGPRAELCPRAHSHLGASTEMSLGVGDPGIHC